MHYADIIAALHKAGYPPARVADELGVSRALVSQVIHSSGTSYNVASFIASVTSLPLTRLWPDGRYSEPPRRVREVA
jgi:lambda repressor-like predicted transcriptional regulator